MKQTQKILIGGLLALPLFFGITGGFSYADYVGSFDGVNDYVRIDNTAPLTDVTISLHFELDSIPPANHFRLFGMFSGSGVLQTYGYNSWDFVPSSTGGIVRLNTSEISLSVPHHFVFRLYSDAILNKKWDMYFDGVLKASGSIPSPYVSSFGGNYINIGAYEGYFPGRIWDFRIWDTDKTLQEISENNVTGILGWYLIDEGAGVNIFSQAGSLSDGVANNISTSFWLNDPEIINSLSPTPTPTPTPIPTPTTQFCTLSASNTTPALNEEITLNWSVYNAVSLADAYFSSLVEYQTPVQQSPTLTGTLPVTFLGDDTYTMTFLDIDGITEFSCDVPVALPTTTPTPTPTPTPTETPLPEDNLPPVIPESGDFIYTQAFNDSIHFFAYIFGDKDNYTFFVQLSFYFVFVLAPVFVIVFWIVLPLFDLLTFKK